MLFFFLIYKTKQVFNRFSGNITLFNICNLFIEHLIKVSIVRTCLYVLCVPILFVNPYSDALNFYYIHLSLWDILVYLFIIIFFEVRR